MPSRMKEDVVPYFVYGTVLLILSQARMSANRFKRDPLGRQKEKGRGAAAFL
jgi:hypothetical protein